MTCNILATGSDGNAILLNQSLLIDCGVPFIRLSEDPETVGRLRIVFLSHIHRDHLNRSTIRRIHRERPSVRFACGLWLVSVLLEIGIPARQIDVFEPKSWFSYRDGFKVRCIPVLHDVPNCAWDFEIDGESVFYATDCGSLDGIEAPGRDLYLIEGNYREEELRQRMEDKLSKGEFAYETRVENTHLSEEQAMRFLRENADGDSRYVLIHRHREE